MNSIHIAMSTVAFFGPLLVLAARRIDEHEREAFAVRHENLQRAQVEYAELEAELAEMPYHIHYLLEQEGKLKRDSNDLRL